MIENFCPKCGKELFQRLEGGRHRPACPGCGYISFGHFSVGVGGLLTHEGRVLLVQRGQNPGKGRWTLPGGYVEEEEEPDRALEREVLEETGLRVSTVGILAVRNSPTREAQNIYIVFGLTLAGSVADLRPEGDGVETVQARFFAPGEIKELGEVGLISAWIAGRHVPEHAPLRRLPRETEEALRVGPGWIALFGVPQPGKD